MKEIETFFNEEKLKLTSFIFRMTRNLEDTEDLLQESLLTAIEKRDQFKNKANFKTWIFSIASNKTLDFLRKEKRWSDNVMDKAKESAMSDSDFFESLKNVNRSSPFGVFEMKEHINLCFTCISKTLQIEKQLALILKDFYGFRVKEISEILTKTSSQIKHDLEDARAKMIDIYEHRCALINKKGICNQCSELNGIFNPKQHLEHKKNEIKFLNDSETKSKEDLYSLRTDLIKAIDPLNSEGRDFQQMHLRFICEIAKQ